MIADINEFQKSNLTNALIFKSVNLMTAGHIAKFNSVYRNRYLLSLQGSAQEVKCQIRLASYT